MRSFDRGRLITAKDKRLLSLQCEYNKLWDAKSSVPLLKLDEPYQRGWVRFFRLRDDALRRKDSDKLIAILKKINIVQYCRRGAFMQYNPRTGKTEPIGHYPKVFTMGEWNRLSWAEDFKRYFEMRLVTQYNRRRQLARNQCYVFIYPFYLVSHVEKYFVTHQRVAIPEIESRIAEIEREIRRPPCSARVHRLLGCPMFRWEQRKTLARINANYLAIRDELLELENE